MTTKTPMSLSIPSKSGSFTVPKELLESDSATLLDLYDWNAEYNPQWPFFRFLDEAGVTTLLWKEVATATHRAAYFFEARTQKSESRPTIVAILANTDTITYFCSIVGLLRAGLAVFPISTRNSADAVRHLLTVTGAQYLLVSVEPMISSLAEEALENGPQVTVIHMPVFEDLFSLDQTEKYYPQGTRDPNALSIILHSSGSTAFPKPIYRKSCDVMQWALTPWYGDVNLTGMTIACHVLPMFHGMGILQIGTASSCGLVLSTFKPCSPATISTPDNFLKEARATSSDMIFSVPFILEMWSANPETVSYLKSLKGLIYGGGPLSKEVGDTLASQNFHLYNCYGCTEIGMPTKFLPFPTGNDWEYMVFSEQMGSHFLPMGDGTYELVFTARHRWTPSLVNSKHEGEDAYATNDLFIPHPIKPGLWKIYGRADDQIILSTGEKTNPGPLEAIMLQDPHVRAAVIFGRGRFQNGILIEPKLEDSFDVSDSHAAEIFKDSIWPTIERLNTFAPQHSRIFKETILIASPAKPFTYTAKGTPRRHAVIKEYANEIDKLYQSLSTTTSNISPPTRWDEQGTRTFIRSLVRTTLKRDTPDDADIFRYGCDSLQAMWIHNQILIALRDTSGQKSDRLPQNCVYQASSISQLSLLVHNMAGNEHDASASGAADRVQVLRDLISRYTASFPVRSTALRLRDNSEDIVLVTGTTGSLGAHLLVHLLGDPSVGKVYALNRISASMEQQRATFDSYGLDTGLLSSSRLCFLLGDLSLPTFGLQPPMYDELRSSITHIIHNAWKVDFNQTLKSYEPLLIGVRHLIDLALSSPYVQTPRLLFTSSMGVFRKRPQKVPVPEDPINDPDICIGSGYSESKWVAEQILLEASEKIDLKISVVRLGQISGGRNGYWNEREWFPALVKSAIHIRCLPALERNAEIAWIPAYEAARVLTELRNCKEPVLHFAHPSPVPWTTVIKPIAADLGVDLVPYTIWLAALEDQQPVGDTSIMDKMRVNPALRLLDHFRSVDAGSGRDSMGEIRMDVSKLQHELPDLHIPAITADSARRWIDAWRECGFMPEAD